MALKDKALKARGNKCALDTRVSKEETRVADFRVRISAETQGSRGTPTKPDSGSQVKGFPDQTRDSPLPVKVKVSRVTRLVPTEGIRATFLVCLEPTPGMDRET